MTARATTFFLRRDEQGATPPYRGTVYVVGFANYVKIGFSIDLFGRLKALQEGTPELLVVYAKIPGTMADERAFHKRFASHRLRGEWFRKEGSLAAWIEGGCL